MLEKARFSSDERIEVLPLCRRLLIRFYQGVVESPDLFPELLPHVHQEHLSRLRRIESKQDRTQETLEAIRGDRADISAKFAELNDAISGHDRKFTETLINAQLDLARQLIDTHRPHAAIELLQGVLEVAADRLDAQLHFRVLSNIGNAHLLLMDAQQAGLGFLEAAKHVSDKDDKAAAQHAWGHLLLGEQDAAERLALAGMQRFPESGRLQAMVLAVANRGEALADPAAAVPEGFRSNHHVAYTVAQIYAQRDDLDLAAIWIKRAYASKPDDWQTRKAYAEILLRRAVQYHLELGGGTSEVRSDFDAASAELAKIWKVVAAGEPIEASAMVAAQVALARKLSGDRDGARRACDAGLAMDIPLTPLLQVAVSLAEEDERYHDVINLLGSVEAARLPERDLLIASAQVGLGRNSEAVQTLIALADNNEVEARLCAKARARSIELRARPGADESLLSEALALVAAEPSVIDYRVVAAALHEDLDEHQHALDQAYAARGLLAGGATVDDLMSVANLLFDLGEPSDAAEIYAELASDPVDSELGRRLLRALLAADSRAALRSRLDAMPPTETMNPFYLWVEAALLERVGELVKATALLDAFLQERPDASNLRLVWLSFLERLNRSTEISVFLETHEELPSGTPIEQLQFSHILKRHGFTEEALRLGYETTRRSKNDPAVHLGYMGLVLLTAPFEPFEKNEVEIDQGFIFESEGGRRRTFVIESGEPFEQPNSIPPDHPVAQAALGKRVGDPIDL